MSDADLDQIRRARLQQLQQQAGSSNSGGGSSPGPSGSNDDQQRRQEAESAARANILTQILSPEAADRLNRIRLVKETRATDVENRLIMLARSGQLRQRVGEDQLKEILAAVAEKDASSSGAGAGGAGDGGANYRYARRKGWDDEDDDLLDGV